MAGDHRFTRREFLGSAMLCAAGAVSGSLLQQSNAAEPKGGVDWPIGCFNRPWGAFEYDQALDGIAQSGFRLTGLLGDHGGRNVLQPDLTPEMLVAFRERIRLHGLTLNIVWLRTRHDVSVDESLQNARRQIDNAHRLGAKFLFSMGIDQPALFEHYYRVMADASAYAEDQGMQVVMKPHGGCSASADEMLRTVERVNHKNFRLWYDAGNIVHYTGKDPVADVARVAHLVTGFCAKDCAKRGGDVMLQFGEGSVDFRGVFSQLKKVGFQGPVMVECCRGGSLKEIAGNAGANREYLERLLRSL